MSAENKIFITPEGEHDYNKKYKQYTFVTHTKDDTTKVYMSIKDVPPFVSILDINYWKFVKSDIGGGGSDNSPKIIHLDNGEHGFDTLTDEQVTGLCVGDIIEVSDVTGNEYGREIYLTYKRDDDDVVYLMYIGNGQVNIIFYKLDKSNDYWDKVEVGTIQDKTLIMSILPASGGILPNILYKLGTLANDASITITLATPTDDTIANVYTVTFDTGNWDTTSDRGPSVAWGLPLTIHWADGKAPSIEPNTRYEISIMDDIAVCITAEKYANLPVEP